MLLCFCKKYLFTFISIYDLPAGIYVCHMCTVPVEAGKVITTLKVELNTG